MEAAASRLPPYRSGGEEAGTQNYGWEGGVCGAARTDRATQSLCSHALKLRSAPGIRRNAIAFSANLSTKDEDSIL